MDFKESSFLVLLISLNLVFCDLSGTDSGGYLDYDDQEYEDSSEQTEYVNIAMTSETKTVFKEGEIIELYCTCEAYPSCTIEFNYIPINDYNKSKTLNSFSVEQISNTTKVEMLRFKAEESCKIVCTGTNAQALQPSYDSKFLNFYVSDLSESLEISRIPEKNVIMVGEAFEMSCNADVTFFTEVAWYKNGSLVKSSPGLQQSLTKGKLSLRNVLKFSEIKESDSGNYVCKATKKRPSFMSHEEQLNADGKIVFVDVRRPKDEELSKHIPGISSTQTPNQDEESNESISLGLGNIVFLIGLHIVFFIITIVLVIVFIKKCSRHNESQNKDYEMRSLRNHEEGIFDGYATISENIDISSRFANLHPDLIPSNFYNQQSKGESKEQINETDEQVLQSSVESCAVELDRSVVQVVKGPSSAPRSRVTIYSGTAENQQLANLLIDSVNSQGKPEDAQENEGYLSPELTQYQIRDHEPTPIESSYIRRSAFIFNKRRTINSQIQKEADEFKDLCDHYNFPKENLEFGKNLGMGAFGVVKHAYAHGLDGGEEKTPVAVKTTRGNYKQDREALMSEIKIMAHIGQHKNVVNLMGIIRQGDSTDELMIMVEYCSLGNVQDYLQTNRGKFINEIDPKTGHINSKLRESSLKEQSSLTTSHLLSWSFQVARGMEFLSSKRVIHGDLAARNILLCEDNFVKICDFGLAKFKRESNYYRKRGSVMLPIKWLAPESLNENIFSTNSDVWSFGVVLWEFFSLGQEPYPGIELTSILPWLNCGVRMTKPIYSTSEIYDVMQRCWLQNPKYRPTFSKLEDMLGEMIDSRNKRLVVSSNTPYLNMNKTIEDLLRKYENVTELEI
uniref:Protein tyrosine kinase n=1 Tax=Lutzomyia longipalpis TaxID=7200 RepID=A0A7G3AU30_LUTLO